MDIRDGIFKRLHRLAMSDPRVVVLSADTGAFGLDAIKRDCPSQFINTGVAEQATILVAAGLAIEGKKPFIFSIIPFITLRCLEIIKVNICHMDLPVTILGLGSGLSFSYDGPTHHATSDIAVMRAIGINISDPCDSQSAGDAVEKAYRSGSPSYIRIDKGEYPYFEQENKDGRVIIVSSGIMIHTAQLVASFLSKSGGFRSVAVNNIGNVDFTAAETVVILEENCYSGGIFGFVNKALQQARFAGRVIHIALPDEPLFLYGSREYLHEQLGLNLRSVYTRIKEELCIV